MILLQILIDNTALSTDMASEHGLSMAIDGPQGLWIWDTGASPAFVDNARRLGVDFSAASGVALSHGHWDHTGGLETLRSAGCSAPVFLHEHCLASRYSIHPDKPLREIGWRGGRDDNLHFVSQQAELAPGLQLHTDIPRAPDRFQAVQDFYLDEQGTRPDTVPDDAALLLKTQRGPALILGCCHSGLANTLEALRQRSGVQAVHTVVGGLHLHDAPAAAVDETEQALREFGVERVFAGHCTGDDALAELSRRLPGRVQALGAGLRIEL